CGVIWLFFFQAEDGIRDRNVTGVQTCALPICRGSTQVGWEQANQPLPSGNWDVVSASALPYDANSACPAEITRAQMDEIRDAFEIGRASCRERGEGWDSA